MKKLRWLALLAVFSLLAVACTAAEETVDSVEEGVEEGADAAEDAVDGDDEEEAMEDDEEAMEDDEEAMEDDEGGEVVEVATDFGVDDETIRVGLSADLSGIFAGLTTVVVDAQTAYFERLNEEGGIAGRQVELVVLDSAYDVPTHLDNYAELAEESADGVVMISQSTGSPHTCLLYTSPSPRDATLSRMPSSA